MAVTPCRRIRLSGSVSASARELDLRARLVVGGAVAPDVRLYGAIAPGYSRIFVPDLPGPVNNPSGLVLGLAGGAAFALAPNVAMTAELGYQFGFQSTDLLGLDIDLNTNDLSFADGLLVDL